MKSARTIRREFLFQIKLEKPQEYCMYFKVFITKSWGKKADDGRGRFNQRFLRE